MTVRGETSENAPQETEDLSLIEIGTLFLALLGVVIYFVYDDWTQPEAESPRLTTNGAGSSVSSGTRYATDGDVVDLEYQNAETEQALKDIRSEMAEMTDEIERMRQEAEAERRRAEHAECVRRAEANQSDRPLERLNVQGAIASCNIALRAGI